MAGEGPIALKNVMEEFRKAVESVYSKEEVNENAERILKTYEWEKPEGLELPESDEEEETVDEEIAEFYDKHVHVTEQEFKVAVLHVNFILEYLQKSLDNSDVKSVKFGKFVPYGAACEGMSTKLVPVFDVLLEVETAEKKLLDVVSPIKDPLVPSGFVKVLVKDDEKFTVQEATLGSQKREVVIVDNDDPERFLSPVGFREYVLGPMVEDTIANLQKSMESVGTGSFRVFLQKTKKSLEIVVGPNRSWMQTPIRQTSFTLSITPAICVTPGDFPIYAVAKPRYWKNISATDPHNPLWQVMLPEHERHILSTLIPKNSYLKHTLRVLNTLQILRLKKNSDTTLIYLNSYHCKMTLLSHLLQMSSRNSQPPETLHECLAEFIMLLLGGIKSCNIYSIFFASDEAFQYIPEDDHSILKGMKAVNVADTLTDAIAGDIRKEIQTTLKSYEWGSEVWTLTMEREVQRKIDIAAEETKFIAEQDEVRKALQDGDLQKNLADDSLFLRIIGISVVIFLLAVVVYSIFGEFEFGSSKPVEPDQADMLVQEL